MNDEMDNVCQKTNWRDVWTKVLLAGVIVLYPFNLFPHGPFLKLSLYPLLGLCCLNFDRLVKIYFQDAFLRIILLFSGLSLLWMGVSLCFTVGVEGINNVHIHAWINEAKRLIPWLIFIGSAFLLPRETCLRWLYRAFIGLFCLCGSYTLLELLHFSGVTWATDILTSAITFFMSTELGAWTNGNFWPPILWDSARCRSVFEEPAYFAVFLGFCALLFTYGAWIAKRWWNLCAQLCLAMLAMIMLCLTRGAAGAIGLAAGSVVWMCVAFGSWTRMTRVMRLRLIGLVILVGLASCCALMTQRHSTRQITNIAQQGGSTRGIHLAVELDCISAAPFCGYGIGMYGPVMAEALATQPERTHEIEVWIKRENEPPRLNHFTAIAVSTGLVGLGLFFGWFLLPSMVVGLARIWRLPVGHCCIASALSVFIVCQMLSATAEIFSYFILMTIPMLFLTDSQMEKGETRGVNA